MIKFNDAFHEDTQDGFKFEGGYKNKKLIRIYQEFDSGIVRDFMLTQDDIKQIMKEMDKNNGKTN